MKNLARIVLLLVCFGALVSDALAAGGSETQAFEAAQKVYYDADYRNAEIDFGDFIQKFPGSARLPEAVLFQAQSRIKLGDFNGALTLLSARQSQAGAFADWYLLCRGQALLAKGDFSGAKADFARLNQEFPGSTHRLAAVVNAAVADIRQSNWAQVIEGLGKTNGVFQLTASTNHANSEVIRGFLLLSEAQLAQKQTAAAEQSLQYLANSPLDPTNNWQRQYLLCRVLVTAGRLDEALQNTTNLLVLAEATGQPSFQAQTVVFEATLLERLGRKEDAAAVYQKNLGAGVPPEQQREALLKITQLSLETGRIPEGAQVLQTYLAQFPTNRFSDLALLTLGELRLRQYQPAGLTNVVVGASTNAPGPTNVLEEAMTALQSFHTRFPNSSLAGKAQLDLGWCYWLAGNISDGRNAFQSAASLLPHSVDQAQAVFKIADSDYQLTNYPAAITNYQIVADRFHDLDEVRTNLAQLALYQVVRASQAVQDENTETNALARIMADFPDGFYTERAVLLSGQQMGERFPAMARELFEHAAKATTNSPLLPELQLAIARTYEQQARWDDAINEYDSWLGSFTNHAARGRAEYFRALANYRAGYETNAWLQFTNFIARSPTNVYAPLAQWWVADYFARLGNLPEAEISYKLVFQNYAWSKLAYPAQMMAGRMAVLRQDWPNAPVYFRALFNDQKCPAELRAQALFAIGDTFLIQNSTNKIGDYQDAFNAFDLLCKTFPTNQITPLAWGQKAICLLQFARASQDPKDYLSVTNAFQQVIDSPLANAAARSIAEVGLGYTLEKIADLQPEADRPKFLNLALRHYERVWYNKDFLRDGEEPDPFWMRKAGLEVARLAERMQNRDHALGVYRRLQEKFPALRLEDKIKVLQAQR